MKAILNGRLVPMVDAMVPVSDRGFLYGDGVFETIRVYDGRPFLLHQHLRRLNESMRGLRLSPPMALVQIGKAVERVIKVNRLKEAVARVTVTRGSGVRGFAVLGSEKPTVVITAVPFREYDRDRYRRGIMAAVVSVRRTDAASLSPAIKSNNCLNQIMARMEAADLGADEAIMLTTSGQLCEASSANVFLVENGAIVTPALDGTVLPGITRERVIRIAREAGYSVFERRLRVSALADAEEIFLTNSTMEIMPVTRLIFNHLPRRRSMRLGPYAGTSEYLGPVTVDLMVRFRDSVRASHVEQSGRRRRKNDL